MSARSTIPKKKIMLQLAIKGLGKNRKNLSIPTPSPTPMILPTPQSTKIGKNSFAFINDISIEILGNSESIRDFTDLMPHAELDYLIEPDWDLKRFTQQILLVLNLRLEELRSQWRLSEKNCKYESNLVLYPLEEANLTKKIPKQHKRQGYVLQIQDFQVSIFAWTYRGAFYGIQTLSQLLEMSAIRKDYRLILPEIEIIDFPTYKIRGLVDDISRGQRPTLENFKKFIQR